MMMPHAKPGKKRRFFHFPYVHYSKKEGKIKTFSGKRFWGQAEPGKLPAHGFALPFLRKKDARAASFFDGRDDRI
ncbi:MAG: hypothetical protein MJ088_05010, partial [Clostridia bacterium]|nr:hypothetical protein [Clostridia bacterium]